jgi:ribonuclease HII
MSTENTKSLMFEMRVMNDIRKLTPEQRKEMMNTIQTEEQLEEEEALKKNPNLHLERNLQLVLDELKEMRDEVKHIKELIYWDQFKSWGQRVNKLDTVVDDYEECTYSEWIPFIIFVFFVLFSFLGKSSTPRPCPITIL